MRLRFFEGLSSVQIAAKIGSRPGAVRMLLLRALQHLRRRHGSERSSFLEE